MQDWLVPEQQWRILAELAGLEQSGTCFLRTLLADQYEAARQEIPDAIATMPCGLLRWQVEKVTRSTTALDRLLAARLIEVQDIPNLRWTADDQETIPLFCLTHAGRAHYAEHWAAYRELYPDVRAPQPAGQTA